MMWVRRLLRWLREIVRGWVCEGVQQAARAEFEAERARFLRHLDHEMKNPLMAIRAGLVNLSGTDDPATREQIRHSMETQVIALGRLVSDLRKVAHIETLPAEREPVDLGALLDEVLLLARDEPGFAARTVTVEAADEPVMTVGDVDLLLHALYNLVQNALKFTRPGDTITLRAYSGGGWGVLEVVDTGPGIHPDDLPHVCEELYRGRGTAGIPGSGIGLALARAIAARHGGELIIDSPPDADTDANTDTGTVARLYVWAAENGA